MRAPRLFALDQGFPQPIVEDLRSYLEVEAQLVPVASIDQRLTDMDDWELLLALHHHGEPWDGLVSTDDGMLLLPRELSALMQTKLTLVVCRGAGHDPIRATGLLLTHLTSVCDQTIATEAQLWSLGGGQRKPPDDPWDRFQSIAEHRNVTIGELKAEEWLTHQELARPSRLGGRAIPGRN